MDLTKPYKEHLFERLRDPAEAGAYLAACLEEGDKEAAALCLQDIAQAWEIPADISPTKPVRSWEECEARIPERFAGLIQGELVGRGICILDRTLVEMVAARIREALQADRKQIAEAILSRS